MEKVYIIKLSGMGAGTNTYEYVICPPDVLDDCLNDFAWEHHHQWFEPEEEDDEYSDYECLADAYATEYTPENQEYFDNRRCGGGSFLDEREVREVWVALGYTLKFEGSTLWEAKDFIDRKGLTAAETGVTNFELISWSKQASACRNVVRVIEDLYGFDDCPPLLQTQLTGAKAMAENELIRIEGNTLDLIDRLKSL